MKKTLLLKKLRNIKCQCHKGHDPDAPDSVLTDCTCQCHEHDHKRDVQCVIDGVSQKLTYREHMILEENLGEQIKIQFTHPSRLWWYTQHPKTGKVKRVYYG